MTATDIDKTIAPSALELEAHHLLSLLREYAGKLLRLNDELFSMIEKSNSNSRAAWLIDQSELLRKPVIALVNRTASLQESLAASSDVIEDELELRRLETEIHLHHMIRQTGELRETIDRANRADKVARLRLAAGLNGMKGGPLRPNP